MKYKLITFYINQTFCLIFLCLFFQNLHAEDTRATPAWIVNKPIIFNELRKKLTREYAKIHYGKEILFMQPEMIVIHYTASNSFNKDFNTFNRVKIHGRKYLKKYGMLNVSAHYMIDRDGTIYKLMDENLMARHVIGLNHCSIGIENVGKDNLTNAQLKSNARLIRYLVNKYPNIKYLIGHYEYRDFEDTRLFIENIHNYRTIKNDPGIKFMKKLRIQLKDLDLKNNANL